MKSKKARKIVDDYIESCNQYGTGFAVTHIPITLLEMCVREAEAETEEKYITLFGDGKD